MAGQRKRRTQDTRSNVSASVSTGTEGIWTFKTKLASACALAFLLRMLHVLQTIEVPTVVQLLGDARGYFDWGSGIAAGNWYGDTTFYQAPLYPYFLAVLIKTFGSSITLMRIVQSLLGVVSVAFVGMYARRMFSPRVGILSATLLAVYPASIYYDGIIQKASLAAFLLCGVLAASAAVHQFRRPVVAVAAGLLLGLLVITRENALLWVPILPVWVFLGLSELTWQKRSTLALAAVAGIALVLVPVAARNASLGGEWSPTTFQAGPNFYIGNNLEATGIYRPLVPGHETPMYERADAQRLAEQASGRELTAREVSKFWMQKSFDEITESPARWIQLLFVKTLMVINRYEVPDVESMYVFRDYSVPLKLTRFFHIGILFPLAIWGLICTRSNWRDLWLHYLLLLSMIAAVAGFFILGRYRLPVAILLIPLAAAGLQDLWETFRKRERKPILIAVAVLLMTGLVSNFRVHDESSLNASSYMNLGVSAGKTGDLGASIQWLQRAIEEFPDSAEAHFNLGRAYSISRQPNKAAVSYQSALKLNPTLIGASYFLGQSLEQMGQFDPALQFYQRALTVDPSNERARAAITRLSK